jgi:hypothetical protein
MIRDETFECICGNQKFKIYAGSIICSACTLAYYYYGGKLMLPREFNRQKRTFLWAECRKQLKQNEEKP